MSNQDWTSKLQDQLAGYQESVSHDLWAGIEQSLAQNNIESGSSNPQKIASESSESAELHVGSETKKNARIVYFKRWSAAAAAVALLGIGGSYVYLHQEDVERVICKWHLFHLLQFQRICNPLHPSQLHPTLFQRICNPLHLNPLHPTLFQRICNPLHPKGKWVMLLWKNQRMKSLCLQRIQILQNLYLRIRLLIALPIIRP